MSIFTKPLPRELSGRGFRAWLEGVRRRLINPHIHSEFFTPELESVGSPDTHLMATWTMPVGFLNQDLSVLKFVVWGRFANTVSNKILKIGTSDIYAWFGTTKSFDNCRFVAEVEIVRSSLLVYEARGVILTTDPDVDDRMEITNQSWTPATAPFPGRTDFNIESLAANDGDIVLEYFRVEWVPSPSL